MVLPPSSDEARDVIDRRDEALESKGNTAGTSSACGGVAVPSRTFGEIR
jgi:hypothetical protein